MQVDRVKGAYGVGLGRLVAGISGSNPAGVWMSVSCVYMLCCPVSV
jgi:hypothetical protein